MKEMLVSLLKPFADLCFDFAISIPPEKAIYIYVAILMGEAIWVLTLAPQRPETAEGAPKAGILQDLRLWAFLILVLQTLIYIALR